MLKTFGDENLKFSKKKNSKINFSKILCLKFFVFYSKFFLLNFFIMLICLFLFNLKQKLKKNSCKILFTTLVASGGFHHD